MESAEVVRQICDGHGEALDFSNDRVDEAFSTCGKTSSPGFFLTPCERSTALRATVVEMGAITPQRKENCGMTVLDVRILPTRKPILAFADLEFSGWIVRDFRVVFNQKFSVKNPFTTYRDRQGKLIFREIISLPAEVQAEAHSLILSAYFRRLKEKTNECTSG